MGIFNFLVVDFFIFCKGFGFDCWGFWIWFWNCLSDLFILLFIYFVFKSFFVSLNFLVMYKYLIVILWFVVIFRSFLKYFFCFWRKIFLGILRVDNSIMYCLFRELNLFGFENFLLIILRGWGFFLFYLNFFIDGWICRFFFNFGLW